MAREVPQDVRTKRQQLQNLATTYYWIHNSVGVVTTGLTTLVAVNTQGKFLWQWAATTIAILATCCTFLMTAFNAKAKAERFELAGREVEKAIILYEYDDSLSLKDLGKAITRAVDLLSAQGKT